MLNFIRGEQIRPQSVKRTHIELDYTIDNSLRAQDIPYDSLQNIKEKFDATLFNTINVSKKGNDTTGTGSINAPYLTIKKAIDSITDASLTNAYKIMVDAGLYSEVLLTIPEYVHIGGSTIYSTIIEPDANNHNIFVLLGNTELSFLTIQNAGSGYVGVDASNCNDYVQLHKVNFIDCDYSIKFENTTVTSSCFLEYTEFEGTFTQIASVKGSGSYLAFLSMENCYITNDGSATNLITLDDSGVLQITSSGFTGNTLDTILQMLGGYLIISSTYFRNANIGILIDSTASNPAIDLSAITFITCTTNLDVESSTATGFFTGYTEYEKTTINKSSTFFITNKDSNLITVHKKGGDFTSVKDALSSITDATENNTYAILVGSGIFTEDPFTLKEYVSIKGINPYASRIIPSTNTGTFITTVQNSSLENILLAGPTGSNGVTLSSNITVAGFSCLISNCMFLDGVTHIYIPGVTSLLNSITLHNCRFLGSQTTCIKAESATSGNNVVIRLSDVESASTSTTSEDFFLASGYVKAYLSNVTLYTADSSAANGFRIHSGAELYASNAIIRHYNKGLVIDNTGSAPFIQINTIFECITKDIEINHTTTSGNIFGVATRSKITNSAINTVQLSYQDPINGDFNITRTMSVRGFATDLTSITSANQTTTILSTDAYCYVVTGSTAGQIIKLPNATTLRIGHEYWLNNSSTVQITIKDYADGNAFVLAPGASAKIKLRDNSTTAGSWMRQTAIASVLTGMYPISCSYTASAGSGRYLEFWSGNPSDASPYVLITNSIIVGFSLNASADSTGTVSVFKSTDLVNSITSLSLSNASTNYVANLAIILSAGDSLVVQVTSGSISKPGVAIYISNY
jgi:hypothetical protein